MKEKLKEYVTNRPIVKGLLSERLQIERKGLKKESWSIRKNNRKSRDMGIYNRLSFSSWALQITFNNQDRKFYTI